METVTAAVIGTGFIGPAHIEALRRIGGVEIVAVASRDLRKAKAIADSFSIPKVYSGWKAIVRDREVQVIHNCTPNNLHFEINSAAIAAGKHVVSEKPLAITSRESSRLLKLAQQKGVVHAVNFNYRFYPLVQQARSMVQHGEIGNIYLVHGHYLQDWLSDSDDYNWRLEPDIGGPTRAVADIGSHWCDLVQYVTGSNITRVCADLVTVHKRRRRSAAFIETFGSGGRTSGARSRPVPVTTEDAAIVMVRFDNGSRGVFTISQVSAGRKNREWFEIDGSKKSVAWDQEEPNRLWIGHRHRPNEILMKDPSLLDASVRKYAHYPGGHPEGYAEGPMNLFRNVYRRIRSRGETRAGKSDFPTFRDGHWEVRIAEAILRSHSLQEWVDVRP